MMRSRRRRVIFEMNVVPYIDIMLVLLIIFMVVAPMIKIGVIALPSVGRADVVQEEPPVTLFLKNDLSLTITLGQKEKGKELKLSRSQALHWLQQRKQQDPKIAVVIAADQSLSYAEVMRLMSDIRKMNIQKIGLLVKNDA